jgi:hypothetical protein
LVGQLLAPHLFERSEVCCDLRGVARRIRFKDVEHLEIEGLHSVRSGVSDKSAIQDARRVGRLTELETVANARKVR